MKIQNVKVTVCQSDIPIKGNAIVSGDDEYDRNVENQIADDLEWNVWEWCLDYWQNSYNGAPADGSAWVTGGDSDLRVVRGGSWYDAARHCRCAYRCGDIPGDCDGDLGFRVVCPA